jgi:hypothetical protein
LAPSNSPTETYLPTVDGCNIDISVTTISCDADTASITITIAWPILESKGQLLKVSPEIQVDANILKNKTTIIPGQEFFLMQGGLAEESFMVPADIDIMMDQEFTFNITILGFALGNPDINDRNCLGKVQTRCTPSEDDPPTGVPVKNPTEMPSPEATQVPTIITGKYGWFYFLDFGSVVHFFYSFTVCVQCFSCR